MSVHRRRRRGEQLVVPSLVAAGLAYSVFAAATARAIVIYDQAGQNTTTPPGGQGWQFEGHFSSGGGTVVAPNVIISAAHIGPNAGAFFTFNGVNYAIDYSEQVGTSDITIAHLALATGSPGIPLYSGVAGSGTQVTVTGTGGVKGSVLTNNAPPGGPVNYGWAWSPPTTLLTWGNNTVAGIALDGANHPFLAMPFTATAGSSVYTAGDSGGGVFVNNGGTYQLAGVAYGVDAYWTYAQTQANLASNAPAPAILGSIYNLSGANLDAAPANQLYTIANVGGVATWVPASSANPQMSYASMIDNDPTYTVNGMTIEAYMAGRISALQNTRSISTWAASSGTGVWSSSGNWTPGIPLATGSTAVFNGTGSLAAVNVDTIKSIGNIQFSGAVAYTLSGNAIYMDNTGSVGNATITSTSSVTQTAAMQLITTSASDLNVSATGTGLLTLTGGIDNTAGKTVTLMAGTGSSLSTAAIINNGTVAVTGTGAVTTGAISGTGSLTQSGSTLTLSAASSFGGGTTLSGGTMLIKNTSGSATGTGSVTLNGGTLAGNGTISGTVMAGSSANTIFPSVGLAANATNTLTLGSLTTNSNTALKFNLVTPGTSSVNDALHITNTNGLTLSGGSIVVANHTTGAASLGYYKIMQYTGTIGGTGISSITLPATANNVKYTLDTTHDPGFVDLHRGFLGDANDNGFVDLTDLTILANNWQKSGNWSNGDFDGSGFVDLTDLTILAENWQTGIGSFGEAAESVDPTNQSFQDAVASVVFAASVPEPASLALLGLGAAGLLLRRRR